MLSARGAKVVHIQRRKSGLDFSIKGGREHGIGVIVSWIKKGGAAKNLRLGDEILAVNGHSLQGLSHGQVVDKLRNAGPTVTLLVRPNQALEDIFSSETSAPPKSPDVPTSPMTPVADKTVSKRLPLEQNRPLPPGWGQKLDQKTGRAYFENHYTCSSTWTDPRTLKPVPLETFEWNALPPGWERFLDQRGDIYYVNHHTQTTHWDSPRGNRQLMLLQQLKDFLEAQREKLNAEEGEVVSKRKLLLEKNQQLDQLSKTELVQETEKEQGQEEEEEEVGMVSSSDLIDDIMLLNDEVESQDVHLSIQRRRLHALTGIYQSVQGEEVLGDEHRVGATLAVAIAAELGKLHALLQQLLDIVKAITDLQRKRFPSATPLHYILQLPTLVEGEELKAKQRWVHTLPDRLTAKTNCELRLELTLLKEFLHFAQCLKEKLESFYSQATSQHSWEQLVEGLASLDFQPLQDVDMEGNHSFREKLERLLSM